MRIPRTAAAAALVLVLGQSVAPAARAASAAEEAGVGVGVVFANLVYAPAKMIYALFGGMIGGIAYGLSGGDEDVAMRVIEPAWRGDYALTPDHLRGKRTIEFFGRRAEYREAAERANKSDVGAGDSGWE